MEGIRIKELIYKKESMEELREHQLELLEMLKEIDKAFKEKNIQYFLVGGSVLGAIRHQKFIPWDDDIDIGLYRKDFERMEKVLQDYDFQNIEYKKIGEDFNESEPMGRVYLKDEINKKNIIKCIDVFPIDNIPENKILKFIQYFFCQVYHTCIHRKPAKNRGRVAYYFTKIILKIFPSFLLDFLQRISKRIITFWNKKETKYVANIYGIKGFYKEIMPKEYIGIPVLKEFEKEMFYVPEQWDKYLTHLYGDYMKLPKEEDRKPKHGRL